MLSVNALSVLLGKLSHSFLLRYVMTDTPPYRNVPSPAGRLHEVHRRSASRTPVYNTSLPLLYTALTSRQVDTSEEVLRRFLLHRSDLITKAVKTREPDSKYPGRVRSLVPLFPLIAVSKHFNFPKFSFGSRCFQHLTDPRSRSPFLIGDKRTIPLIQSWDLGEWNW